MATADTPVFSCKEIRVEVSGRVLVDALDFVAQRGELIAVLGENGAGKSLTMHTLAGLRPATAGHAFVDGHDVATSRRQDIAMKLALLPQHVDDIFPATVLDTALIGRHPHIGRFQWESAEDRDIAMAALAAVDLADLSGRDVLTLSGGERRRLAIAQVLTQRPAVYLLDEPTNHLDPQHQLDAMRVFRGAADRGATVVATLHDVNFAARFAYRCLLLFGDGRWEAGSRKSVLNASALSELYSTGMEAVSWRGHELFVAGSDNETL